jgi:hypothetical protein
MTTIIRTMMMPQQLSLHLPTNHLAAAIPTIKDSKYSNLFVPPIPYK